MSSAKAERIAQAERAAGYFELQLTFAALMAERTGLALSEAVGRYTNLHRRFGLGDIDLVPPSAEWARYVGRLEALDGAADRLAWTLDFFLQRPEEAFPAKQTRFGCFSCEAPDTEGAVRIHFDNADPDQTTGPLARGKVEARTEELRAMSAFLRANHPEAKSVKGGSWLYNLEAYRRLFPPAYAASLSPREPVRLSGTSSWGQFLDHHGLIKPDLRERFLAGLPALDVAAPWRSFPLRALAASAPADEFYGFYGV